MIGCHGLLVLLLIALNCYDSKMMSPFGFKQAVNIPALRFLKTVIQQPRVAVPNIELSKLTDLNLPNLKERGVKYLVFDKDNTIR